MDNDRIAILSNGPSAVLFDMVRRDCFRSVIGVNWTVNRWLCDWWCFTDWVTFAETQPLNDPRLCVSKFVPQKLPANAPEHIDRFRAAPEIVIQDEIALLPLPAELPKWNAFSGCAALGLAWHLRARHVTVFGADMSGEVDHAGRFGPSRTPERYHSWNCPLTWTWKGIFHEIRGMGLDRDQEFPDSDPCTELT